MSTYITAQAAHPLGRWLAALAVSLVLLALAYAQAPDPAGQLGLRSPNARTLANSRPAPDEQHGRRLVVGQALAAAQLGQPTGRSPHPQFAR